MSNGVRLKICLINGTILRLSKVISESIIKFCILLKIWIEMIFSLVVFWPKKKLNLSTCKFSVFNDDPFKIM